MDSIILLTFEEKNVLGNGAINNISKEGLNVRNELGTRA